MLITSEMIDNAAKHGACAEMLTWLREEPRKWAEVRVEWRIWAATHCTHPDMLAHVLRYDDDVDVRAEAAYNLSTPPEALAYTIRHDADAGVRWWAAGNPATPPEALRDAIRHDAVADVRMAAAGNPSTPPEALRDAIKYDTIAGIRLRATWNPNTPATALIHTILHDKDANIRREAARNLSKRKVYKMTDEQQKEETTPEASVHSATAENLALPQDILAYALHHDPCEKLCPEAAENFDISPEALAYIAKHDVDKDV